ncbi:MAG TPA: hypothetical protein VKD90_25640 [Gemmataceae bacterium]|nr:hypothetical protein [Gemmataceae bacterium]
MDRVIVRTCSARQASILRAAAGRCTRVRGSRVRIYQPSGPEPTDPDSSRRYVARIEVLDAGPGSAPVAPGPEAEVVDDLFGVYLHWPAWEVETKTPA